VRHAFSVLHLKTLHRAGVYTIATARTFIPMHQRYIHEVLLADDLAESEKRQVNSDIASALTILLVAVLFDKNHCWIITYLIRKSKENTDLWRNRNVPCVATSMIPKTLPG
jgi:hypothetical protein